MATLDVDYSNDPSQMSSLPIWLQLTNVAALFHTEVWRDGTKILHCRFSYSKLITGIQDVLIPFRISFRLTNMFEPEALELYRHCIRNQEYFNSTVLEDDCGVMNQVLRTQMLTKLVLMVSFVFTQTKQKKRRKKVYIL